MERQRQTNTQVHSRRQHSPRELRAVQHRNAGAAGKGGLPPAFRPPRKANYVWRPLWQEGQAAGTPRDSRSPPQKKPCPSPPAYLAAAAALASVNHNIYRGGSARGRAGREDGTAFSRVPLPPAPVARGPRWRRGAGRVRARRGRRLREGLRRAPSRGTGPRLQGGTAQGGLGPNRGVLGSW